MTTSVTTGSEFQVNTETADSQIGSSVTALSGGGFVVIWESREQDGSGGGIYGQRYNADGTVAGGEFLINTETAAVQQDPSVTALSDGGFVVAWESWGHDGSGWGAYGQRYDSLGVAQGAEFQINTETADWQTDPSVTGLSGGGFVVTWESWGQDGDAWGVYGQRYDSSGATQGAEFQINAYTADSQDTPSITALLDGGFVVAWTSSNGQDGSDTGVYGQRYDSSGATQGAEFQINTNTTGWQNIPSITGLSDGGFVVAWESWGQDGSDNGIFGQRYDSLGVAQGAEFQINTFTASEQDTPSITALSDGGFVVSWTSYWQDDDASLGIYGQRYDSSGVAQGAEFQINTYSAGTQATPSISGLSDGGFAVAWMSFGQDGSNWGIYGQIFSYTDGDFTGGNDNITLSGPGQAVNGLAGDDVINGADYAAGADIIYGGAGSDTLNGGAGDDMLYGTGLSANGDAGVTNYLWGGAGADTLVGAEGDDLLVGGAGADEFVGGAGDDWIYMDGDDNTNEMNGGAGLDRVFVNTVNATFVLDVTTAQVEVVFGGNEDTTLDATGYNSTVYLIGAAGNDTVTGGNAVDVLWGYGDNDTLSGNGSTDWLYAGTGSDSLTGGAGDDYLVGGAGLGSGDGSIDTFYFADNSGTDRIYEFDDGIDIIDMSAKTGLSNFNQLTIASIDGGMNSAVTFGGDTIYLIGINAAQLSAEDFWV